MSTKTATIIRRKCQCCSRFAGTTKDRCGQPDPDSGKLGSLEKCDLCGLWRCPDCEGENDCCFMNTDFVNGEIPAPPGWRVQSETEGGRVIFERIPK